MQSNHFSNISHIFPGAAVEFSYTFCFPPSCNSKSKGTEPFGIYRLSKKMGMFPWMVRLLLIPDCPNYKFIPSPFIPGHSSEWPFFPWLGKRLLPLGWATGHAIKRVIAWWPPEAKKISKAEIARQLEARRIQVARFLDPENSRVQLAAQFRKPRSSEDLPRSLRPTMR